MSSQKVLLTTWGHPTVNYGGESAKVLFTPAKFDEFREIMDFKGNDQKSGGMVHYQDEDGDWVPIESQAEYDEALKYLKHCKVAVPLRLTFSVEERKSGRSKSSSGCGKVRAKEVERQLRKLQKETAKSTEKCSRHAASAPTTKECTHGKSSEKLRLKGSSVPPAWFEKYMQKFKGELLTEVAAMLEQGGVPIKPPTPKVAEVAAPPLVSEQAPTTLGPAKPARQDTSSIMEPLAYMDLKSSKLMKKLAKTHNCEKKLKKLNSKLEQLELKRSRLLEWNRKRQEQPTPLAASQPPPQAPSLMDAAVLSGSGVSDKSHVTHNAVFTKSWRVMNTGNMPWTEKTELRLAWLTQGLKPLESVVSCPQLQPGEEGDISITFQAPDFAGLFESYWHFYNDDERFGQWMGCAVIVDPKPSESSDEASAPSNTSANLHPNGTVNLKKSIKELQLQVFAPSEASDDAAAAASEDRGEYDSDPDDNNNVSHSDNDNQSSSDSDDSDDSESFVHVPMPPCYQYQAMPLFNIQPGQEELSVASGEDPKEENVSIKPSTPPTTPREPDSEEELFEEASGADSHVEASPVPSVSTSVSTSFVGTNQGEPKLPSPPVHILPETFVTGAINVANRALSATEAIMKTIHGSTFNLPAQMEASPSVPSQPSTPQDPSIAIPLPAPEPRTALGSVTPGSPYMEMLQEMGFNNLSLNANLLTQHSNNLSQVVAELLSLAQNN